MGNICSCCCQEDDSIFLFETAKENRTSHINGRTNHALSNDSNIEDVARNSRISTIELPPETLQNNLARQRINDLDSAASGGAITRKSSTISSRTSEARKSLELKFPADTSDNNDANRRSHKNNLSQKRKQVIDQFQNLIISNSLENLPKLITKDEEILHRLCTASEMCDYKKDEQSSEVYELKILPTNCTEYSKVYSQFRNTNKYFYKVHSIERVYNPHLMMQYVLKINEYRMKGIPFQEKLLFHGTKKSNVDGICEQNFNWRLTGASYGHKFGQGVSFSPIAYYSTHYGDTGYNKMMIASIVLVGRDCLGTREMTIPPLGFDTSTNGNLQVYVKYEDNSFYPTYLIHYGGIDRRQ